MAEPAVTPQVMERTSISSAWPAVIASPLTLPARRVCRVKNMSEPDMLADTGPRRRPAASFNSTGISRLLVPSERAPKQRRRDYLPRDADCTARDPGSRTSDLLVGGHIPAADDLASQGAIGLLLLVL